MGYDTVVTKRSSWRFVRTPLPRHVGEGLTIMGEEGLRRLRVAVLLSALLLVFLTGCTQFQVETRQLDILTTTTHDVSARPPEHNVAVLAIDFDPPLDTIRSLDDLKAVSLLVAVENTGLASERNLTIRAELRLDSREPSPILVRTATVDQLAPGEVKVVRFQGLSEIPIRTEYWLKVRAIPVVGESDVTDNQRIYRLQLTNLTR